MPARRQNPNPLAGFYRLLLSRNAHLVLGALAVLAVLFCGYDATRTRPSDGTVWLLGRPDLQVLDLVERMDAEPTPLRRGDYIVGLANHLVSSPQSAAEQLRKQRPGTTVTYLIKRDGRQFEIDVPLASTRVDLQTYAVNLLLTMIYLLIGFWVYWRSDNDRPASLFFILCLLFGLYFMTNLQQASYFLGAIIAQNIGAWARFMLPPVFLHFFLVFPRKKMALTRHPFLAPLLYILPLMFYSRFTVDQFIGAEGAKIHTTSWILLGLYYLLGLIALLHGYFSYRDPMMRGRVRILTLGTLAAVLPFLVFKIGMEELTYHTRWAQLGVVPLAAIPISFGYCVARYRVMQIEVLLKRSLSYGLLTGLIWIGYLLGAWWLGSQVLSFAPAETPLVATGVTLAVATALWPLRARLQKSLDHRFYHSRDNMAALLEEFSKEIPRIIQREPLLRRVGNRLCEVLALPGMSVYLPPEDAVEPGEFQLTGIIKGRQEERPHYPRLLNLSSLSRYLETSGEPFWADEQLDTDALQKQAITREQAELHARLREQQTLVDAGIQLLIPLVAQERLVGLVALPHRPGDESYELHELQLLSITASQVALQIENARLYEEEVAKQKLEEEMALARRIQARLLPRELPSLDGIEIEAVNISSKQVSGDYYDLIERPDGKLGLVVADVSGKGMPASLLASNIQAVVHALCVAENSPGEMLERINLQIHATTDPQHFATLFLAIFDPDTRQLRYSSGGHNAPVLMRENGDVELLDAGGLPLGAFDFGTYAEGVVTLDEGDLVFLYTDGVTETKGRDGDEDFGEERLNTLLRARRNATVAEIFDEIHRQLERFSGRMEADDDLTMLALKVTAADSLAATGSSGFGGN